MDERLNNLAVFTDSFDGMSDVWQYYYRIFDRYWPGCRLHRCLVTNNLSFDAENLDVIQTGDDRNWFTMTYKALAELNEKYVFFMIEDDFMSLPADETELANIIDYMEKNDIFFYKFTCPMNFPKNQGYLPVHGDVIYPISVQPSIWRRDKLMGYLSELQGKGCVSPWDFERYFIDIYKDYNKDDVIPGIRYDSRNLFGFTNGIIQGKWDPRIVKKYKKEGIVIDMGERGAMPFGKVLMDGIKRNRLLRSMSFEKQAKVKKFLKKLGMNFIT